MRQGKEIPSRIDERKGRTNTPRPQGKLVWIHAASVGEAQSALILVEKFLTHKPDAHILMTTGTVTSANLMKQKLPSQAIHQFYPLDHPGWVERFLDHWKPDLALWMESELWPNMLNALKSRKIPAVLVNARLSDRSYKRWKKFENFLQKLLQTFSIILTQTDLDKTRYQNLGADNVIVTDNIKYSAAPLSCDEQAYSAISSAIGDRPFWLYASTHDGEEALALRIHKRLERQFPNLLTILAPRHPKRGDTIGALVTFEKFKWVRRSKKSLPETGTQIYIADTMGELGLFYKLSAISVIGRSFSDDGGGGHNPIEAAQLRSAVLYGPHVQFQQDIYDQMKNAGAAMQMQTEDQLVETIQKLLSSPEILEAQRDKGYSFAKMKEHVIDRAWQALSPILEGRL